MKGGGPKEGAALCSSLERLERLERLDRLETQPEEEAVSDTGEGPTEGPGDKVRTPGEGRPRGWGTRYVHLGGEEGPGDKVRIPRERGGGHVRHWGGAGGQGTYIRGRGGDPARGGGRVRHWGGANHRGAGHQGTYTLGEGRRPCLKLERGRQPRGHWTRYVHPGEGTQPQEEAVSDTGEGLTTEGPGDKVCTPGEGRRGRGTRYVHPGKGGYLAQEEAISDTGEGPTTEGPGNKVRTPGVGEGGVGGEGAQACRGEGTKEHGRKYKS